MLEASEQEETKRRGYGVYGGENGPVVKARITAHMDVELQRISKERGLSIADVLRLAVIDLIERDRAPPQEEK